jgi:DNA-binding XRE family transcriptional regulator
VPGAEQNKIQEGKSPAENLAGISPSFFQKLPFAGQLFPLFQGIVKGYCAIIIWNTKTNGKEVSRMSEIVCIYKTECYDAVDPDEVGEGCSLLPWKNGPNRRGKDDGGRDYILPKDYTQGTDAAGAPAVFGGRGSACGLILHNGRPVLVDSERRMAYLLEPVKKIATYRHLSGLTLEQLAQKLGVTQKQAYEWENLEKKPTREQLERIASALGCNVSDLQ